MTRLAVAIACMAAPVLADTIYPEVGTVFVYDTISTAPGLLSPTGEVTITIVAVDGDVVVYESCSTELPCNYQVFRDVLVSEVGYFRNTLPTGPDIVAQMRSDASAIPIEVDITGGVFPLEDGKALQWREQWQSPSFDEAYNMRLLQTCCVLSEAAPRSDDDIWRLDYSFETEGPDAWSAQIVMLYDVGLRFWVERSMTSIIEGEVAQVSRHVLREVILP